MDARDLKIGDGLFDAVIDKACFDAVLCGENSGPNSEKMINEVYRVLNPNGVYICVTYGVEKSRLTYFEKKDWTITCQKVAKPYISTSTVIQEGAKDKDENFHFIYIMKKVG